MASLLPLTVGKDFLDIKELFIWRCRYGVGFDVGEVPSHVVFLRVQSSFGTRVRCGRAGRQGDGHCFTSNVERR